MPAIDLRTTPLLPDELREKLERPATISATCLDHADNCLYSGALYLIFGGGANTHALIRGTIFHEFAEAAVRYMLEVGEPQMPPEVAKDRMESLIAERSDVVLPEREQDILRLSAWHWALATYLDPATVAGVELTLALDVAGWKVRGRVDLALLTDEGRALEIHDYKTSLAMPSREDFASAFKVKLYALLAAEGVIDETGLRPGEGINTFACVWGYPRHWREDEGDIARRHVDFTRAELFDFRLALERLLGQISEGIETGEFPAVAGSHCGTCPAATHCPIDARYREAATGEPITTIENEAQAVELATERLFLEKRSSAVQRSLRKWVDETGSPITVGDYVYDFAYQESREVDHDGLRMAVERAAQYGENFDPADFIKVRISTPFRKRKLTEDERP